VSYVAAYKYAYLSALLLNVIVMLMDSTADGPEQYAIAVGIFALNAIVWVRYLGRRRYAPITERLLSLSRMVMPIMAATVGPLGLVAQVSPLSRVVWVPVLALSERLGLVALWACCALLLALEVAYYRAVGSSTRDSLSAATGT
jgi:hypothetical protein